MINYDILKNKDNKLYELLNKEIERQEETLELIPSECIASEAVITALGTPLTNKYSEGYPGRRYYGGNEFIDQIETIAQERAKELFNVPFVNVQPYSGSPANLAVYNAVCEAGDKTMGQSLLEGGHLTHGWKVSATGKFFDAHLYGTDVKGYLDMKQVRTMANKIKPKLIWCGSSAYSRIIDFEEFGRIADEVGAYLVADIAHIAGLVASGVHPSPVDHVHIVTTTTHKTLGGPRGGLIMVTDKGIQKDAQLPKKINSSVFPGLQGGPHNHQTFAIAIALAEANTQEFRDQNKQIVKNAQRLADNFLKNGINIVSGGTDNHLLLLNVGHGRGQIIQDALDAAGITTNKNTIPHEPCSAFHPSGIRIGTPIVTMRGMKEEQMDIISNWILEVMEEVKHFVYTADKEERKKQNIIIKDFIKENKKIQNIRNDVMELCRKYPIYS